MKVENSDRIQEIIVPGWSCIHNYASNYLGCIWVCWNPKVISLTVVHSTAQAISCNISENTGKMNWIQSFIYGSNNGIERRELWQHMVLIKNLIGSKPWLLSGDFKVVCSMKEKWSYGRLSGYESDFVDCNK